MPMAISPVWGAITGDVVGSVYEGNPHKSQAFPLLIDASRYTDDTVLTVAVADAILHDGDYGAAIRRYGRRHPNAGYGGRFMAWLAGDDARPYYSWGNGSAMRVSAVGVAFDSEARVLEEAARCAAVTHDHPEGIKGAQATALAIHLGLRGGSKRAIRTEVQRRFGYDLGRTLAEIRPGYRFDVSCQGSVPESIISFLESASVEDAIRKAVSLGGDADTMACIAGAIAAAHYGELSDETLEAVRGRLPAGFLAVLDEFDRKFPARRPATA